MFQKTFYLTHLEHYNMVNVEAMSRNTVQPMKHIKYNIIYIAMRLHLGSELVGTGP